MVKKKKQGFWQQQWSIYRSSWRQLWTKELFIGIACDIGLILSAGLFGALFFFLSSSFLKPLLPFINAIANLEMGNPSSDARMTLWEQYSPDLVSPLVKMFLLFLFCFLLFIVCYALFKTIAWERLRTKTFSWRQYKRNLLVTLPSFLLTLIVPFVVALKFPLVGAFFFLFFSLLTLLFLPLVYAFPKWPFKIPQLLFASFLFVVAAGWVLLLLWLLNGLFSLLLPQGLAVPFLPLLLGLIVVGGLLALLLLLARRLWPSLHAFLLLFFLFVLTWFLADKIFIPLMLLHSAFFILYFFWLLLFIAWGRKLLLLFSKHYVEVQK